MLHNIKELYGAKIAASDGEIGHVKDCYFDDKRWVIRYLVVDTGAWLSDRQVLISPHAFGPWDRDKKIMAIKLTRKQIEDSPPIDSHRPVSRQSEQDYHQHYGWPAYWEGGGMWGIAGFPVGDTSPSKKERSQHGHNQRDDLHLRSTTALTRYGIHTVDGEIGTLRSFMVDDKSWAIGELVVETGRWYSEKEILIAPSMVERIDYDASQVLVRLTKAEIQRTTENDVARRGA